MNKIKKIVVFGVFTFSVCVLMAGEGISSKHKSVFENRKPKTQSEEKVRKIEEIIFKYIDNGSDIKDKHARSAIVADVKALYPVNDDKKTVSVDMVLIRKEVDPEAQKKFPSTDKELSEKYAKEADEIYNSVPLNSVVTVTYTQGPLTKTITGKYYGLTYYKDGIRIENDVVPLFDLCDADKSKFDEKLRILRKKEYVALKTDDYREQKKKFADTSVRERIEKAVSQNEENGFIFMWNKWLVPEKVANVLLDHIISASNRKDIEPVSVLEN